MQKKQTDDIISSFLAIGRQMRQRCEIDQTLRQEVTIAQLEALRYIGEQKKVTMKEVGSFLSIAAPSATVLIDRLVRLDLVLRDQDSASRRSVVVQLTKKGKDILRKALLTRRIKLEALLDNLNQKDRETLFQLLEKMIHIN